jgi:hypothetical protein
LVLRRGDCRWPAEPRMPRGGRSYYSALAIRTTLTLRAVFGLALHRTDGLISLVLKLLGLNLVVPDHSALSPRAETLETRNLYPDSRRPVHLLIDSTGLRLCGLGECRIIAYCAGALAETLNTQQSDQPNRAGADADPLCWLGSMARSATVSALLMLCPIATSWNTVQRLIPAEEDQNSWSSALRPSPVLRRRGRPG